MNARDELFLIACCDMPVTSSEVNEAIDAYAHELAEKIRLSRLEVAEGFKVRDSWRFAWEDGRDDSADLIDPEVEK